MYYVCINLSPYTNSLRHTSAHIIHHYTILHMLFITISHTLFTYHIPCTTYHCLGNLFFTRIGEYGQYLSDFHVALPNLQVKRDWWVGSERGLAPDMMVSMFDRVEWWEQE
ncbi:hypothetical protein EON63_23105, partial [archaeon]